MSKLHWGINRWTNEESITESMTVIPLPAFRYGNYEDFDTMTFYRGWRYLRLGIYFRIRRKVKPKIIFDIMFDWTPIGVAIRVG